MTMSGDGEFHLFEAKMKEAGLSEAAIKAFQNSYQSLVKGQSGTISENMISPASNLPYLEDTTNNCIRSTVQADPTLLKETVVLKLNGGLGTSMGLDKAKSLLYVKENDTFLDLMAKQILELRKKYDSNIRFVLMNSFSTSADTLDYLRKYPELINDEELELMQNKVPKVDAKTMKPAECPSNVSKEWCPPGHGDLYASLLGSGKLEKLLAAGFKYMFVSNSDNLGASLDLDLLTYFAQSEKPFLMECCERTENDKKGGHLAIRAADGRLILRESAQCDKADEKHFQNISLHRYFNTNNLWVRLDRLAEELKRQDGIIPLPMIRNSKTVDPKDSSSAAVYQLETAMGAAIECFESAGAVCVPRTRFAPVKTSDDLMMLRSDAYTMTEDFRPILSEGCKGKAPIVSLDSKHFKLVQQLEASLLGNVPSLVNCQRLKVTGSVMFAKGVIFEGDISVVNGSCETKTVLAGTYKDTTIDLTNQVGLGPMNVELKITAPIAGQKPGTSGLRKKTKTFMEGNYLQNFVQSTFDAIPTAQLYGGTLVISGDGRYYNNKAIQIIIKMAVANGVGRIWIGKDGLLSTPAVSAVIREREGGFIAFGGFILTASHNPGGPNEDFGIKYNCENGGPAPPKMTNQIFENTKVISTFKIASNFPDIDISSPHIHRISAGDGSRDVVVEIFDPTEDHVKLLKKVFDFGAIRRLIARPDFSFVYDSMHGVQGPYARQVFIKELGASESCLLNAVPKEDFNGGHADPNLTYAHELTKIMGIDRKGLKVETQVPPPSFGAACDGDADRNMILGSQFFVTPSDSVAVIAANANIIPFFKNQGGLKGVARSMPTSGALDLVARENGYSFFEVPTGWKFFGNLMDSKVVYGKEDYTPLICGEESFGTGSNHVREKDGMWAVLAWLSILADRNCDESKPFVSVEDIVKEHWAKYGRNYYCRYDYDGVEEEGANKMMQSMSAMGNDSAMQSLELNGFTLKSVDEFSYNDPVDRSISTGQGIRFIFTDGSRIIFRLSGTGVSGATVRMYIEKYEVPCGNHCQRTSEALAPLIQIGLELSRLQDFTGRMEPTVIT